MMAGRDAAGRDAADRDAADRDTGRSLGLATGSAIVTASMIGAGVFTTSGYAIASLRSPWWVITAWCVAGIVAICGAIAYGALATRFTASGGEYLYLGRTLHPAAGLMAGWVSLLAGFTAPIAAAAVAAEAYLRPMLPPFHARVSEGGFAIALILVAAGLHTLSVRPSARFQDLVVGIKFIVIAAFLGVALFASEGRWEGWEPLADVDGVPATAFLTSLLYISFSYAGFNASIYIAGEMRDAARNVPRSMVIATVSVTILYVAMNAIFVLAPPRSLIAGEEQVARIAAESLGGPSFANVVAVVILLSLFTSVSAMVMTGPRVYAKMADDGYLPRWFRHRSRPPVVAIWFQAVASIGVVCVTELLTLLFYLGMTLSLCSALTVSMLFRPGSDVGHVGHRVAAGVFVVATFVIAAVAAWEEPLRGAAAVLTIGLGAILYPFSNRPPKAGDPGDGVASE